MRTPHPAIYIMILIFFQIKAVSAASGHNFGAQLGSSEIYPATTNTASGQALFRLSEDGHSLNYKIMVCYLSNIVSANIQLGVRGPVVATIYRGPTIPGQFTGALAQGELTAESLTGPLAGRPLSVLIEIFRNRKAYLIINTEQTPNGEIGGQIK